MKPYTMSRLAAVLLLAAGLPAAVLADNASDCSTAPAQPWQLPQLLARAEACNPDLLAARQLLAAAQADQLTAGERPNPTLTLGVSNLNPHAGIGSGTLLNKTVDSSLRLDQLIERGGKADLRVAQAKANTEAVRSDLDEQVRQQRLAVASAWLDLAAAQQRQTLLQDLLDLYQQSETLAGRRVKAGDLPANDLTRLQLDTLRARNDLRQATSDARQAIAVLAQLLGLSNPPASVQLQQPWPDDSLGQNPASSDALDNRPDLQALRFRVQAAQAGRDLAKALATRDVSVGVQADHWPTSPSNQQGTGNSYSVYISAPLQLRHQYQGEILRGEADYASAEATLQAARTSARLELLRNQSALDSSRERWLRLQQQVLPASAKVAANARLAYDKGASSIVDLLESQRTQRQVALDGLQARADFAKALVNWQITQGYQPDFSPIASATPPASSETP